MYLWINNIGKPTFFNINSSEPVHYPFTVSVIKCGGSCNIIDDPYARVCVWM